VPSHSSILTCAVLLNVRLCLHHYGCLVKLFNDLSYINTNCPIGYIVLDRHRVCLSCLHGRITTYRRNSQNFLNFYFGLLTVLSYQFSRDELKSARLFSQIRIVNVLSHHERLFPAFVVHPPSKFWASQ